MRRRGPSLSLGIDLLSVLGLGAALIACTPSAPSPSPPGPAAPSTVIAAPPIASAPASAAGSVEPPAPAASAPVAEEELSVALAVEARLAEPGCPPCGASVGFHGLGQKLIFQAERRYAELDGRRPALRPDFARGLPARGFTAVSFFGEWPTSAYAQLREDDSWEGGQTRGALHRWEKDRWRRLKDTEPGERYDLWARGGGAVGAIVHSDDSGVSARSVFVPLDAERLAPMPELSRRADGSQRLLVVGSASLASGHVFVLGLDSESQRQDLPSVERFNPGERKGTLEALPLPAKVPPRLEWRSLAARSASDVYVAGVLADPPEHFGPTVSYLARFDGTAWRLLDVPQGLWAPVLAVAEDGALWVLSDLPDDNPAPPTTWTSQLLRRAPSGQWSQIRLRGPSGPLGPDVILSRIFVHGSALWIAGFNRADRDRVLVWTTAPVDAPLAVPP